MIHCYFYLLITYFITDSITNLLIKSNFFQIQDPTALPNALTNLVGKTYLFKIVIEKENYVYKSDTYKVLKIITNADMINEFDVNSYPTV